MPYSRGAVVKGPDPIGDSNERPWLKLSDSHHPFNAEEGLYAALTRTDRAIAVEINNSDFVSGGLPPGDCFASPWILTTFKNEDMHRLEGEVSQEIVDDVAQKAAWYLGVNHRNLIG